MSWRGSIKKVDFRVIFHNQKKKRELGLLQGHELHAACSENELDREIMYCGRQRNNKFAKKKISKLSDNHFLRFTGATYLDNILARPSFNAAFVS